VELREVMRRETGDGGESSEGRDEEGEGRE